MFYSSFISSLIFGGIAAYMAHGRGKNPYLWFFLGVFFGVFSLLFLFVSTFRPKAGSRNPAAPRPTWRASRREKDPSTIDITPQFDPKFRSTFWYYLGPENEQNGPMSFEALTRAWSDGTIKKSTFVWNEQMDAWKPFGEAVLNASKA